MEGKFGVVVVDFKGGVVGGLGVGGVVGECGVVVFLI